MSYSDSCEGLNSIETITAKPDSQRDQVDEQNFTEVSVQEKMRH